MASSNTATEWTSRAPTRIDLGGGTVDIWPIFHYLDQPLTINLGISVYARARLRLTKQRPVSKITKRAPPLIVLRSRDQAAEARIALRPGWENTPVGPKLDLHRKFLHHFLSRSPESVVANIAELQLETEAESPAGAGLGGSSTLSISILGALNACFGLYQGPSARLRLVEIARDTETTIIQVPAGLQDYFGAAFGGLQLLRWSTPTHDRQSLSSALAAEVADRLELFYSGYSRKSGINNWVLFKKFIDGDAGVRAQFQSLVDSTNQMAVALEKRAWRDVGKAIRAEWTTRRKLATGIDTPEMARAMARAMRAGASATKVCGAGGGGCFFIYFEKPDPRLKEKVARAVLAQDPTIRRLPFQVAAQGLHCQ
ncbi:MAG: hypothetical protein AAB425_02910 [Bdellovibrionota bacterium]